MSPAHRQRIFVIDDHAVVRAGLIAILSSQADLTVAAEAGSVAEAGAVTAAGLQNFDVILLDIGLPDGSGWELLQSLRAHPGGAPPVLVLSSHREDEYAVQALRSGAAGFLSKESAPEALVAAVRRVANGGRYVSAEVAERLAGTVVDGNSALAPHERLTPREFTVFQRIATGRSLVAIGAELHVSPKTVTSWRARILDKLGLDNNAALTRYALAKGLITTD